MSILLAIMSFLFATDYYTYISPNESPCISDSLIVRSIAEDIIDQRLLSLTNEKVRISIYEKLSKELKYYFANVNYEQFFNSENHDLQKVCFYSRVDPDNYYQGTFYSSPQEELLYGDSTMIKISFIIPIDDSETLPYIDERTLGRLPQPPPFATIEIVKKDTEFDKFIDPDEYFSLSLNLSELNREIELPVLLHEGEVFDSYVRTVFNILNARDDVPIICSIDNYNWPKGVSGIPVEYFQSDENFTLIEMVLEKRNEDDQYSGYLCLQPNSNIYMHHELYIIVSFFDIHPSIDPNSRVEGNLVLSVINERLLDIAYRGNTYRQLTK